jgi:RNA polymerase sigma-70 factor, ECF subfamily
MTRAADGAVLRRVYRVHVDAVFAFFASTVDRHTAEDLTASTFERVIRSWASYDPALGGERAWLMAIARNLLRDHFRRSRFRVGPSLDEHPGLAEHLMVADDGFDRFLSVAELHAWLSCLGEREREILALRYGADLPAADIAALVDLTPSNVHQIISRSLRRLRQQAERIASTGARGA